MAISDPTPSEDFVTRLTSVQGPLYAYICTLLGGSRDAADILQEANLVLWRKAGEYDPTLSFNAWAYKIAFYQVLAFRKRQASNRHRVWLSKDSLDQIASRAEDAASSFNERIRLLDECIDKLPEYQRQLIQLRYANRLDVKSISTDLHKSENSVAAALYRARQALVQCVETTLHVGGSP